MHSVLFVHPEGHNGRRFDDNKVQSLKSSYQTVSYSSSFVFQAWHHASVDVASFIKQTITGFQNQGTILTRNKNSCLLLIGVSSGVLIQKGQSASLPSKLVLT